MNPDFNDLVDILLAHDVRFLIVGGIALAAHGLPRATGDLDIWVEAGRENALRVYAALSEFGAPLDDLRVDLDDFMTPGTTAQFGLPPRRIDVLTAVEGLEFEAAWGRRYETALLGRNVPFLSLADMLQNKEALRRDKDIGDIHAIRRELARRRSPASDPASESRD